MSLSTAFPVKPLRRVAAIRNSNVDKLSIPGESPVRLCNYVDVYRNDVIHAGIQFMRATASASEIFSYRLRIGDVLITKDSELWTDIGVPSLVLTEAQDLLCGYHLTILRPRTLEMRGSYLARALRVPEIANQLHVAAKGVTRYGLALNSIKSALVPVPSPEDQVLIVRYLDHAEMRIAKAIAGKNELVRLLQEKRQVVVEEIVLGRTLGRPVTDTGIPWIGKMPTHWELAPLRSFLRPRRRLVGREHMKHALLSLTLGGVILRDLSEMKGKFPASFESYQEVRSGDFVMCLFDVEETPRTVGLSSLTGMITGAYDVFESLEPASDQYLYEYLLTVDREKRFQPLYRGLRKTVPRSSLLAASVPVPPTEERNMLVDMAQREAKNLDRAIASLLEEIALLKEYRVRLISDVVTGKLDVRKEAANLEDVDPNELAAVLAGGATSTDEEEGDDGDE